MQFLVVSSSCHLGDAGVPFLLFCCGCFVFIVQSFYLSQCHANFSPCLFCFDGNLRFFLVALLTVGFPVALFTVNKSTGVVVQ